MITLILAVTTISFSSAIDTDNKLFLVYLLKHKILLTDIDILSPNDHCVKEHPQQGMYFVCY